MGKVLPFETRKFGGDKAPAKIPRQVFTCKCGCQEFWFHVDGSVSCTSCEKPLPIHWEPDPGTGL